MVIRSEDVAALIFSDVAGAVGIGSVTPGEVLQEEFMIPLGLSRRGLAREPGMPSNRITEIVAGGRAISAETAIQTANLKGTGMWPSLETATRVSDFANWAFIASLVVGVIATVLIVWMSGVKEHHWDVERQGANQRIAELSASAETAKAEIAKAQSSAASADERAAMANERSATLEIDAAEARLEQRRIESAVAWRVISPGSRSILASGFAVGVGGSIEISYPSNDSEALFLASQISDVLKDANIRAKQVLWVITIQPRLFPEQYTGI
jgi:addiction module HigA family antidote